MNNSSSSILASTNSQKTTIAKVETKVQTSSASVSSSVRPSGLQLGSSIRANRSSESPVRVMTTSVPHPSGFFTSFIQRPFVVRRNSALSQQVLQEQRAKQEAAAKYQAFLEDKEKIESLLELAKRDDADAIYKYALFYHNKVMQAIKSFPQKETKLIADNTNIIVKCYKKAAKQGHGMSLFKLGDYFEHGWWGDKTCCNLKKAMKYYLRALKVKDNSSIIRLCEIATIENNSTYQEQKKHAIEALSQHGIDPEERLNAYSYEAEDEASSNRF